MNKCKNCNGTLNGDGYSSPLRCENLTDEPYEFAAPDEGPFYCTPPPIKCGCGKGYASSYDGLCRFCREELVSRAEARKVGVQRRGDGISIDQYLRTQNR